MAVDVALRFGPFTLLPAQRILLEDGAPLRLGSRAFDLLVALIERAGEVVSNATLISAVWPNVVVAPGALRVHMAGLRKVLGDGRAGQRYIVNIPLQGYCFVAPVVRASAPAGASEIVVKMRPRGDEAASVASVVEPDAPVALPLPAQVTRLIGRESIVEDLLQELPRRRCVTLVGPAGMGKTSVALSAARQLEPDFGFQTAFVNLAPLNDPSLVLPAVTSALGVSVSTSDPMRGLLAYLRDRRMLILLDNCEHLIETTSSLAESLLTGAPRIHLLVTSREPLRIQGEWVQRLGSLPVPPSLSHLSASDAQAYASVELFVERVRAGLDSFELHDGDTDAVAAICRAVDGIPLALELAAAGVERMGVRGVAAQLGNRLALLTRGRRTALPRHQTLRAALDWGYALLTPREQSLLRALSIFRNRFTAESAAAVVAAEGALHIEEDLYNLVSKSLLLSDISGDTVQYWLLETTREYARSLLDAHREVKQVSARHATHMLEKADAAERLRSREASGDWAASHAYLMDDIRSALHWSLATDGDLRLGAALVGASAPLWFALSGMAEFLQLVERFLEALGNSDLAPAREIAVREAHGHAVWHIRGAGPEAIASFRRALELAEHAGSTADRLRVIWGLWLVSNSTGDYAVTVRLAQQFGDLAAGSGDASNQVVHHRMMTMSMHFTGEHAKARHHAERVLSLPLSNNVSARNSGFTFDQRTTSSSALARILWVLGYPEQALRYADAAVERATQIDHSLSLCFALAVGCVPVAFWAGDEERIVRYTTLLRERSHEFSLSFWHKFAEGYDLVLERRAGSTVTLETLRNPPRSLRDTLCTLDESLVDSTSVERAQSGAVPWCTPEILRVHGDRLRHAGNLRSSEATLQQALELANAHEALSWQLRCATSLASLRGQVGRPAEGAAVLRHVLGKFTEGHHTADLVAARRLLETLPGAGAGASAAGQSTADHTNGKAAPADVQLRSRKSTRKDAGARGTGAPASS